MRSLALVLCLSLGGCSWLNDELARDVKTGQSKLEQQVNAVAPALGPYGQLAIAGATLITGVAALFHAKKASDNTEPDGSTPPKA